jgi:hypothetical protein
VSYLTLDDPRGHFLLGQTAIALRDPVLLAEAGAFLRFLELPRWVDSDAAAAAWTPEFTLPEPDPGKRIATPGPAGANSATSRPRPVRTRPLGRWTPRARQSGASSAAMLARAGFDS